MKKKKLYSFPVIIERDEHGWYVGTVPSIKSCYTQAKTLPKLFERLEEIVKLCLGEEDELPLQNEFLGVQKLEFSV